MKLDLAQYRELAAFAPDSRVRSRQGHAKTLAGGARLTELLKGRLNMSLPGGPAVHADPRGHEQG